MTKIICEAITELGAVGAITFLSYQAMSMGINGFLLAGALACIAGLAGFEAKNILNRIRGK